MSSRVHIGKADSVTIGGRVHNNSIVLNEMNISMEELKRVSHGTEEERNAFLERMRAGMNPSSCKKKNRLVLPGGIIIENAEEVTFGDTVITGSSFSEIPTPSSTSSPPLPNDDDDDDNEHADEQYLTDQHWIGIMESMRAGQEKRRQKYASSGLPIPKSIRNDTLQLANGKKYSRTPSGRWRLVREDEEKKK